MAVDRSVAQVTKRQVRWLSYVRNVASLKVNVQVGAAMMNAGKVEAACPESERHERQTQRGDEDDEKGR